MIWAALLAVLVCSLGAVPALPQTVPSMDVANEPEAALRECDRLIEMTKERAARARLYAQRATILAKLDRLAEANDAVVRAKSLDTKSEPSVTADILIADANNKSQLQEYGQAIELVREARALLSKVHDEDSAEIALADTMLGRLLVSESQFDEGIQRTRHGWEVMNKLRPVGDDERIDSAFQYAIALVYSRQAALSEPLLRKLVSEIETLKPRQPYRAKLPNLLGTELLMQGRINEAIPWLRQSVDVGEKLKSTIIGERADALSALGVALLMSDRPADALPFFQKSAEQFAVAGAIPSTAGAYINGGTAADRAGDRALGMKMRETGIAMLAKMPRQHELAVALNNFKLAQSYTHAGRLEEAEAMAQDAASTLKRLRPPTHFQALNSRISLGWIKARRGRAAEGLAEVRDAFRTSIAVNNSLEISQNRVVGVIDNIEAFSQALETAILAGDNDFAFEVLQVLVETDASRAAVAVTAREQAGNSELGLLLRRRQEAAGKLADADAALLRAAGLEQGGERAPLEKAVADARAALSALDAELDTRSPGFRSLLRPRPVTLAETQARLGRDETLLVVEESDLGLYTMALTHDRIAIGHASIRREALRGLVRRIRAGTENGALVPFDTAAAHEIYQAIFTPEVRALVPEKQRLRVVTGDILSALPLTLLASRQGKSLADTRWLVEDHAISVLPSLATLGQSPKRADVRRDVIAIGAPALGGTQAITAGADIFAGGETRSARVSRLVPLPGAEREIAAVAAHVRKPARSILLTGQNATEPAVRALDYSQAGVLLFATHGLVSGAFDARSEPALVLTPPTQESEDNDGLLTASEAARLRLDADWVILSACDTAAGDQPSAAGYTGLARAFLFAGARRVVASHWPVRDDVAARLSVELLDASAKGATADEALRRAILKVMKQGKPEQARNPALWAPFMVVGN